jgi:hypothetical protein
MAEAKNPPTGVHGGDAAAKAGKPIVANETIELFHRLLNLIETGWAEQLRRKYIDMLGIRHLSDLEQDKMLISNRAYTKAVEELNLRVEKEKKNVRELFDKASGHRTGKVTESPPLQRRRERLERLRRAQREQTAKIQADYERKKKLYDEKFEKVEADAYNKGLARIEEDKKRFEELSTEFETKLKQEQDAIKQAEETLAKIENVRETAEMEAAAARKVEEEIKKRIKGIVNQLKISQVALEKLSDQLAPPPTVEFKEEE